jgi:hypothetical protein
MVTVPDGSTYKFLFDALKKSRGLNGLSLDRVLFRKMTGPEHYIIGSDSGAITFQSFTIRDPDILYFCTDDSAMNCHMINVNTPQGQSRIYERFGQEPTAAKQNFNRVRAVEIGPWGGREELRLRAIFAHVPDKRPFEPIIARFTADGKQGLNSLNPEIAAGNEMQ